MKFFTRKKRSSNTGDIEMLEIPAHKRLGRKKTSSTRHSTSASPITTPVKISENVIKKNVIKIYRTRVRKSMCRFKPRKSCKTHKSCKYASGKTRKFCRKLKNKRI
jgi:hypothetical protein